MATLAEAFGSTAEEAAAIETAYSVLSHADAHAEVTAGAIADVAAAFDVLGLEAAVSPQWTGGNSYVLASVGTTPGGVPTLSLLERGSYFPGAEIVDVGGVTIDISEVFEAPAAESSDPEGGSMPRLAGISGCTALPDSGGWVRRAGCRLYSNGGAASATMWFDYSVKSGGGRMDGTPYSGGQQCLLGLAQDVDVRVVRRLNSGSVAAQSRHSFRCVYPTQDVGAWHAAFAYGSAWSAHN